MLKAQCGGDKFKLEHIRPEDFANCFWQKRPKVLAVWIVYRVAIFVYFLSTFLFMTCCRPEEGFVWYKEFIYFGYWSYLMQVLTLGLAFVISLEQYMKEKKNPRLPEMEDMPWHYKTLWVFYNFCASSAIACTLIFWCFTYDPDVNTNLAFSIVSGLFNSSGFILDCFLCGIPFRFLHFYLAFVFGSLYILFTVAYQLSGGTGNKGLIPIYSLLDWRKPVGAIMTAGLFIGTLCLLHWGVCVFHLIKTFMKPTE